jgi:UDP-N-acetylglucosamine acyltransferase
VSGLVHPTALVDPAAKIGKEVRIGPYAIVEAECAIGDGCEIRAHAIVRTGTTLGPRNQVGHGAVLGGEPQVVAFKGGASRVEIGADNRIGEYVTIHRATKEGGATKIGDGVFLMGGVHVGHDSSIGNRAVLANNTLLGGHVEIGEGAFLGGATIVHQFTRIGRLAITRGGSGLGKDVPPYFMAAWINTVVGLNRIGMRRAGFSHELRRTIQAAYDMIYRSNLNVAQALAELRAKFHGPEIAHLLEFIASSKRGICRARDQAGDEEE